MIAAGCADDATNASGDDTGTGSTTEGPEPTVTMTGPTTTADSSGTMTDPTTEGPTTADSSGTTTDPTTTDPTTTDPTTTDPTDPTTTTDPTGEDSSSSTTDDTETGGSVDPTEVVDCNNAIPAAPAGQVCGVTAGNSATMLINGDVLAGHRVYEAGSVLVDTSEPNGRILCVGCDCADEPAAEGATVLDCADGVVSPGLINPHDHITFTLSQPQAHGTERYDHRHEWRDGQNGHDEINVFPGSDSSREGILYGELRMLMGGATSITGSSSGAAPADLLRNLDAAANTGGLVGVDVNYRTFPLGDSGAETVLAGCDYPNIDGTFNLEDDVYLPHIAEGVNVRANNEFLCMTGAPGGEELVVGNTSVIHGIGLLAEDIQTMAEARAELVWSPRSNVDLYGITADLPTFRNLGVAIALGTDWTASGSMNVLRELKCADSLDRDHYGDIIPDLDLWLMVTYWAALSQGAEDQIGLLRPGHIADIAIFDGSVNTRHRAVIDAGVGDVALVMRGGEPLYGNDGIISALLSPGDLAQCEAMEMCDVDKRVCSQLDSGLTVAAIQAAVHVQSYELFFCDEPEGEPSCDPFREMEFPARDDVEDGDGDGIPDDDDNCPTVFNPTRPLDGAFQADGDGDGVGDSCDLCPTVNGQGCDVPNVYDRDADTVLDFDDNCPEVDNADQADADTDGNGDVCDACPATPNPGGGACPVSIYDIKDGTVPFGTAVLVSDALVTGVGSNGFFVQVHEDEPGYVSPDYSGLFVFGGLGSGPQAGDRVSISGSTADFFGQTQLVASGDAIIESTDNPDVTPVTTTVAAIVEGGSEQETLEGVVVTIADLTVTDTTPPGGPGDAMPVNEFEVEGGLRVNDFFYVLSPPPVEGQVYASLTGVSRWANDYSKLEPRGPQDVPATLATFGPSGGFVYLGDTDAATIPTALEVRLSAAVDADTFIAIASSNDGIVGVDGGGVTVLDGSDSAIVSLSGNGLGQATLTATYVGNDLQATVNVIDPAALPVASLPDAAILLGIGGIASVEVTLDIPAPPGGWLVDLAVDTAGLVAVPASVLVPEGSLVASFDVTGLDVGNGTLTVSVGGNAQDTVGIEVIDAPVFDDLRIVEAYYNHTGNDTNFEWVKIYNGTPVNVDLADYALAWGGTDYTYGTLDLSGTLDSGACALIGGPQGNALSGFPGPAVFDVSIDLNPDLQNSGATADGLALFDVAAASITPATVPVHAVIYGTNNVSGLLDESGAAGNVDVADSGAEASIRMNADGTWAVAADPTPTLCVPLP